jgi:hypothetical protein
MSTKGAQGDTNDIHTRLRVSKLPQAVHQPFRCLERIHYELIVSYENSEWAKIEDLLKK